VCDRATSYISIIDVKTCELQLEIKPEQRGIPVTVTATATMSSFTHARPIGLCYRQSNHSLYVAFANEPFLARYDTRTGSLIATMATFGSGLGQLIMPSQVYISEDDTLMVFDERSFAFGCIVIYNKYDACVARHSHDLIPSPSAGAIVSTSKFFCASHNKIYLVTGQGSSSSRVANTSNANV
jgi:hypothetical protein